MATIEFFPRPSITQYISVTNNMSEQSKFSLLSLGNKEYFTRYNPTITTPATYEKLMDLRSQVEYFLTILKKKMDLENEGEIIDYLLNKSLDIDKIIEPFLFVNKITNDAFFEKTKIFIQKYDDPETKDHFIAVKLRQKYYPDDFIDKIWDLRETFSAQFEDNDWILITTDYRPLSD